jgi:hypothetical protein
MSEKQQELKAKHGTPDEFERAVWAAYAGLWVTEEEAKRAIGKYRQEWRDAA